MSDCQGTLLLVEGEMEREALRKHFKLKAKRIGVNGDKVAVEVIVKAVITAVILSPGSSRVLVMLDREQRGVGSLEFAKCIQGALEKRFPEITFKVIVPDRDTEAWIFADRETCSKHLGKAIGKRAVFEGEAGAKKLRTLIGPGYYDKMTDGVALFGKVKWTRIVERSASARQFAVDHFFTDCEWFKA